MLPMLVNFFKNIYIKSYVVNISKPANQAQKVRSKEREHCFEMEDTL